MYHFFVDENQIDIENKRFYIEGSDVNHIKNVLRLQKGDEISLSNGIDGKDYRCGIVSMENDRVEGELYFIKEDELELPSKVILFQGLPKADKLELIIQKAVELGAYEVVPVSMKRCVVKLDEKKATSKEKRWQQISEAAAKQSKRRIIPKVSRPMTMKQALEYAKELDVVLLPYELSEDSKTTVEIMEGLKPGQSIGIFIGPEGGFDEDEVLLAKEAGAVPVSLGKRILRTETAGMTLLSIVMYYLEIKNTL